jgi:hypothetical protein
MDGWMDGWLVMQSIKSCYLFHNGFDIVEGNALIVASNDKLEQIVTKNLKDHAHMVPIHSSDLKKNLGLANLT